MRLGHITDKKDVESIGLSGLIGGYKSYRDTILLTDLLHSFKPENFSSGLNIKKCIWFTPGNTSFKYTYYKKPLELVVNAKDLDQDKLYFVDGRITERIEDSSGVEQEELCKNFWRKLRPFSEYLILFGDIEELERNIDVLYFGDVPPEKLEIVVGYKK